MNTKMKDSVSKILATYKLSFRHFLIFEFIRTEEISFFIALPKKRFSAKKETELTDLFLEKIGYCIYFS